MYALKFSAYFGLYPFCFLTGCPALHLFGQDVLFFDFAVENLILHIGEAQTGDGVREALSGYAFVSKQQEDALHGVHNLLLAGKDLGEGVSGGCFLAPSAAKADLITANVLCRYAERTFVVAAAAVIAGVDVHLELSVVELGDFNGAGILDLTFFAALAFGKIKLGHELADDSHIIELRLYTVIGTAAHGNLKFVGQGYMVIALVEALMNLFA